MAKGADGDLKSCIWMKAGVIDFKSCHKWFDCPNCDFDLAMTETAAKNQALWKTGQKLQGRKAGVVLWQDKMARRDSQEQMCRHMLTGRVANKYCRRNYLCYNCAFDQLLEDEMEVFLAPASPEVQEVFGIEVPTSSYLHRGHTWVALENAGRVRIGLDAFSQKVLGPSEEMRLPAIGTQFHAEGMALALSRQGKQAAVLAPLEGIIEAVNPQVRQDPGLPHDDPYGQGWLFVVIPGNLKADLGKMVYGQDSVNWIEHESHRLLGMLESAVGVTLPSGGMIVDDVFGAYPELEWERLVREFLHTA